MITREHYYSADYLGVANEAQYTLLGSFFTNSGIERVKSRLPYILERQVPPDLFLQLDSVIRQKLGVDQFLSVYRSPEELREPHYNTWARFQGSVAEILGEEYVRITEGRDKILISNQDLIEAITCLPLRYKELNLVTTNPHRFNFSRDGRAWHNCPDLVSATKDGNTARVTDLYELKSSDTPDTGSAAQKESFDRLLANPGTREILRKAIGEITETAPDEVLIPTLAEINLTLVALSQGKSRGGTVDNLHTYYDRTLSPEIPSIRSWAYFIMAILNGKVTKQANWENYFLPVDPKTANAIMIGRSDRRVLQSRTAGSVR